MTAATLLHHLQGHDRVQYAAWRRAVDAYHSQLPNPESAYAGHLEGVTGPTLPFWIKAKLFDAAPTINVDDTDATAAEKYRGFVE